MCWGRSSPYASAWAPPLFTIGTGVTVQSGATVTFKAPTIRLRPGFHAEEGAVVSWKPLPTQSVGRGLISFGVDVFYGATDPVNDLFLSQNLHHFKDAGTGGFSGQRHTQGLSDFP